MHQIWVAVGIAVAVIAVGVPFAAIILVSIASRREEAAHTRGATERARTRPCRTAASRSTLRSCASLSARFRPVPSRR